MQNLSDPVYAAVWSKTEGHCFYCGNPFPVPKEWGVWRDWLLPQRHQSMTMDHKLPINRGGTDDVHNLLPCCSSCNSRKNVSTVEEFRWRLSFIERAHRRFFGDVNHRERNWLIVVGRSFVHQMLLHNFGSRKTRRYFQKYQYG